jgi:magnesium chelatase subunit H
MAPIEILALSSWIFLHVHHFIRPTTALSHPGWYQSVKTSSSCTNTPLYVLTKESPLEVLSLPSDPLNNQKKIPHVVLVAGFESFNKDLYLMAASKLSSPIHLSVFADREIRSGAAVGVGGASEEVVTNPLFSQAVKDADVFIGSLIFDYDDVMAVSTLLRQYVKGPRLLFECATELMVFNRVGAFTMDPSEHPDKPMGPPPAVKAILSKFSSGKEEDKLSGYIKLLKVGPELLKFVPGEKAGDLRTWLELYRYWNQGGISNVSAMLQLIQNFVSTSRDGQEKNLEFQKLPELQITPDIGLLHPLKPNHYFKSPREYVQWRESNDCYEIAKTQYRFELATRDAPRVAILLYRKHVITEQRYISDLITQMEKEGILPIPIFINGVEAHTIVRDLLTSNSEIELVEKRQSQRDSTFRPNEAVVIDAIVSTIGFPLVGGPAGSMEAGRNVAIAEQLLKSKNVPYIIASPLLLQSIPQWRQNGVLGMLFYKLHPLLLFFPTHNMEFIESFQVFNQSFYIHYLSLMVV